MPSMSSFANHRPRAYFGMLAAAGLIGAIIVPWLLVAAANMTPDKTLIAIFDDRVANWLNQHGTATSDALFRIISLFGDWLLVAVVLAAVLRFAKRRQLSKAAGLVIACAGAALLNAVLALTFRRAHSLAATNFESVAQGVNFPSGHSMLALVAYGMLTYFVLASTRSSVAKQVASVAAAAVLVGLIGLARVYLGVHSVSDVVLGFTAGAVWLVACILAYPRLVAIAETRSATAVTTLQPIAS